MTSPWPHVHREQLKFVYWAVRHPRRCYWYGRYARHVGLHLTAADRFAGRVTW
jgi:hypothetical protein